MNYQLIQKDDVNKNVNLTLTLGMIKILHNACVDVLRTLPEYPKTAYAFALEEIEEIILQQETKNK